MVICYYSPRKLISICLRKKRERDDQDFAMRGADESNGMFDLERSN